MRGTCTVQHALPTTRISLAASSTGRLSHTSLEVIFFESPTLKIAERTSAQKVRHVLKCMLQARDNANLHDRE